MEKPAANLRSNVSHHRMKLNSAKGGLVHSVAHEAHFLRTTLSTTREAHNEGGGDPSSHFGRISRIIRRW